MPGADSDILNAARKLRLIVQISSSNSRDHEPSGVTYALATFAISGRTRPTDAALFSEFGCRRDCGTLHIAVVGSNVAARSEVAGGHRQAGVVAHIAGEVSRRLPRQAGAAYSARRDSAASRHDPRIVEAGN